MLHSLDVGLTVYFLPEKQFNNLASQQPFLPDSGSWSNSSHAQRSYLAETVIRGAESEYYIVLLNRNPDQSLEVDVEVTLQVAGCLAFLISLLLIPGLLLALCYCACTRRTSSKPRANITTGSGLRSGSGADETEPGCCCEYYVRDEREDSPPAVPAACRGCAAHKLPLWGCIHGYPALFWRRPNVSWSRWWRQQVLLTWPWNPEEDEVLDLGARQMYVLTTLLFNLLALTLWNEFVMAANRSMGSLIPKVNTYVSRYIGSFLLQYLFFALFKPLLTLLFVVGPEWRLSTTSALKRAAGTGMVYTLQITFVILLTAECYSAAVLFSQYRCSVLLSSLIVPYFCYELLKMSMVFGFIPLPLWFWVLNIFGPTVYVEPGPYATGRKADAQRFQHAPDMLSAYDSYHSEDNISERTPLSSSSAI